MINFDYDNCESLINMKPRYFKYVYIILIIFGGVIIWINNIYINDIYYGKAYIECDNICNLTMTLSIDDANDLNNINYLIINDILIDNFNYDLSEIKYDIDNQINYQILSIKTNNINLMNRTIQDIKIFYNEDILFNKIISLFLN